MMSIGIIFGNNSRPQICSFGHGMAGEKKTKCRVDFGDFIKHPATKESQQCGLSKRHREEDWTNWSGVSKQV